MITQVAQLTWEATREMPISLIPDYVEKVANLGGTFLIYRDRYLNVQSAMKNKKRVVELLHEAENYLLKEGTADNEDDEITYSHKKKEAVARAGSYHCLYLNDLGNTYSSFVNEETAELILSHPDLEQFWKKGFSRMESCLYEDSD